MPDAYPLVRNVAALREGKTFDLLVVGGGIYGAWTAYDAARRGMSVALVERKDWGCGTSQSSSKLIHGGLRYLEHFEFSLVRHALIERRVLARVAPHVVRPLNFILPVWREARVGMFRLGAGLILYDWLSLGWQPVQSHKRFRRERLLKRYPFLLEEGLRGGFRYGDCQEDDARLVSMVVAAAQGAGAVCANGVAAESLIEEHSAVTGAQLHDVETGARFALKAKAVVGAAGPWVGKLGGDTAPKVKLVKGTHLVLPAIPGCHAAFLLTAPQDGRVFFVIPWYHRTLVGTTEQQVDDASTAGPTAEEESYLLAAVNAWMPSLNWTSADVIGRYAGTRALQAQQATSLSATTREFEIVEPRAGLFLPIGGKYTTARHDASRIVDRICTRFGRTDECSTHAAPLPGAPPGDFGEWQAEALRQLGNHGVDAHAAHWLTLRHGARVSRICDLLAEAPHLAERLDPDSPFIEAEAWLAASDEMARDAEDAGRRRIPLGILARPGPWQERVALRVEQGRSGKLVQ